MHACVPCLLTKIVFYFFFIHSDFHSLTQSKPIRIQYTQNFLYKNNKRWKKNQVPERTLEERQHAIVYRDVIKRNDTPR